MDTVRRSVTGGEASNSTRRTVHVEMIFLKVVERQLCLAADSDPFLGAPAGFLLVGVQVAEHFM